MILFPDSVRNILPPLYNQERNKDPIVYLKFFTPLSCYTWYISEGSAEDDDFIFFGYTFGHFGEWGYISLNELQSLGDLVERDLYFTPGPWSDVRAKHDREHGGE
jgi:hypothetical protein